MNSGEPPQGAPAFGLAVGADLACAGVDHRGSWRCDNSNDA